MLLLAVFLLLTAAMPFAGRLDGLIESVLAQALDRPVRIGNVEAGWRGLKPLLQLDDVYVLDHEAGSAVVHFDSVEADVSISKSLLKLRPFVETLSLRGTRLTVVHETDDRFSLRGFKRSGDTEPVPVHRVLEGLLGVKLKFHKLLLLWDDKPAEEQFELYANSLDLYAGKNEVGVEGEISLPQNLGDDVRFKAVARGPFEQPADWNIDFYLRGDAIDLEGLPLKRPGALAQTESGILNVELWGAWSRAPGLDVQGDLELYDLRVNEPAGEGGIARFTFIDELVTKLRVTGDFARWRLDLDGLSVITPNKHWLPGGMSVGFDSEQQQYSGAVEYADLGSIAAIAVLLPGLSDAQRGILQDLNLAGDVSGLHFKLPQDLKAVEKIEVSGAVAALGWAPVDRLPGLAGLSVEFDFADNSGWAQLTADDLTLNAPRLFRQALEIKQLQTDLTLQQSDDVLEIIADNTRLSTSDFQMIGTARLALGGELPKPQLDLEFISPGAELVNAKRYLPARIMPPQTVRWLDQAFLGGRASDARVTFNGPLSMPAFKSGEAKLHANFRVEDGHLHYQDGWPEITNIRGTASFENANLKAKLVHGQLFQTTLSKVDVAIANLFRSELDVSGKAKGPLINGIDFVDQTPIGDGMHDFLKKVSARGDSSLDLQIHLPLTRKTKSRLSVDGKISLSDDYLALPDYDVEFEQVSGKVAFTERAFSANGIEAVFRGSPVTTDIATAGSGEIVITTAGQFAPERLLPQQTDLIQAASSGSAYWVSEVLVPSKSQADRTVRLKVTSDLQGIALGLPEPLKKAADEQKTLQIEYEFTDSDPELVVTDQQYFLFRGIMDLEPEFKVQRAGIGLSGINPAIPESGIRVEGFWPGVDYNKWYDFVTTVPEGDPDQSNPIDLVDDIEAELGQVFFAGQEFRDLQIHARKEASSWQIQLDSPAIKGSAQLPVTLASRAPWRLDLEHLTLKVDDDEPVNLEEAVNPALIPPLSATVGVFSWGDRRLENLRLVTAPRDNGMNILEFSMKSELLSAVANGQWLARGKKHRSSILLSADGRDVGQVLADLGLDTSLGSGVGTLKGQLEWDSVPYDLRYDTLRGVLEVDVADGVIHGVEPGLGRIIGLLSLDQLPRRLGMDFKDVSEEGFHYDMLSGRAEAGHGKLKIEHLDIDGSIASLAIAGETDLLTEKHNLSLQLVPKFKASVPIAAGLLAGPQAGVLVFIVDKLAEGMGVDFNESAALDFLITGSWEEPVIEPVEVEPEDADETDLYDIPLN